MSEGFHFVASPYSHADSRVVEQRYAHALRFVAWAAQQDLIVYSPIAHWHEAARLAELPSSHEFWLGQNLAMLRASRGLIVLALDGWKKSAGVAAEIAEATEIGLPIDYYTPAVTGNLWVFTGKWRV